MQLLEAARWAPSSFNNQEWRFVYGLKGSEAYDKLMSVLADANKAWCKNAGGLILATSRVDFEHNDKPNSTHEFACGAACQNLALQAASQEIVCHMMAGFSADSARELFAMPDNYEAHAMIALGYPAAANTLPPDLKERELPSDRKALSEICAEGQFPFS